MCHQVCCMLVDGEYSSCGEYEFLNQTSNSCQACPQCQPGQEPHMVRPTCTLARCACILFGPSLCNCLIVWEEIWGKWLCPTHFKCTHAPLQIKSVAMETNSYLPSVAVRDLSVQAFPKAKDLQQHSHSYWISQRRAKVNSTAVNAHASFAPLG